MLQSVWRKLIKLTGFKMLDENLIVIILGATGTGKSNLAIEIAQKYNGEIISADSMQVYKGLDIVTNKVTETERSQARHYLIDFLDPLKKFTVVDFRDSALPIINNIWNENKLPIVVGGTNYYIEALLFDTLLSEKQNHLVNEKDEKLNANELNKLTEIQLNALNIRNYPITNATTQQYSNEYLHSVLKEIDEKSATELHFNCRRKVLRRLQVYQQTGQTYSQLIVKQRKKRGASILGGPIRFHNVCMLYLQCEQDELDKRLDARVDKMINDGLLDELKDFHANYNRQRIENNEKLDYTEGIFQSIGFKEFHSYLINEIDNERLLTECIENMKASTRKYSRKQLKWINNRLLCENEHRIVPDIYSLDCTDLNNWSNICELSFSIIKHHLDENLNELTMQPIQRKIKIVNEPKTFYCEICQRTIIGKLTWQQHLQSRKHEKRKRTMNRQSKTVESVSCATNDVRISE